MRAKQRVIRRESSSSMLLHRASNDARAAQLTRTARGAWRRRILMTTRRDVITGAAASLTVAAIGTSRAAAPAEEALVALPGKKPLIRRSFRPPNFETPLA